VRGWRIVDDGRSAAFTATERWFLKRGLPHFIADYSITRDVLTRAVPFLTVVLLLELVNAPSEEFPLWLSGVAIVVGFGILLAGLVVANLVRGRPAFARPRTIGAVEVCIFIFVPAIIPAVFDAQWGAALGTIITNIVILALTYLVLSYGVFPMLRWAGGETIRELNAVVGLFVRALPLLVLFVTFIFLQNEAWQITASLHGPFYVIVLMVFPLVGLLFAALRLRREVGVLADFESWSVVVDRVRGTPAEPLAEATARPPHDPPPLTRRQWGNVGLVVLFSQGLQILFISLLVFLFLVFFGVLVCTEPIVSGFIGGTPHVLATIDLWGRQMLVTEELLRVAGFLAVFSGFYFGVSVLTDETYRDEFLAEVVGELRRSLAVRTVYLAARDAATLPPT
jgi:hypothetical protein